jgi:glycosyltransferase involved in cell wall biosynthesis
MVQIEAHASGLPIVSTRTAGAEYILNGSKAGTLVDFGAELPARLGEVIATYASSDELRSNASAAALHVAERFSFEAVGRLLVETIESAVPDPVLHRGPRDGPV